MGKSRRRADLIVPRHGGSPVLAVEGSLPSGPLVITVRAEAVTVIAGPLVITTDLAIGATGDLLPDGSTVRIVEPDHDGRVRHARVRRNTT